MSYERDYHSRYYYHKPKPKERKWGFWNFLTILSIVLLFVSYWAYDIYNLNAHEGTTYQNIQYRVSNEILESTDYIYYNIMGNEYKIKYLDWVGAKYSSINNYPNTHNPTYEELLIFLKSDQTDQIPYDYNSFVCADFAILLHNNAESNGIKTGVVSIDFNYGGDGHALNVFNTTDKGMVFIDCTGYEENDYTNHDKIVNIHKNELYTPISLFDKNIEYYDMGIVQNYYITW
jgi:hypothetical protein